ncbi:COQ9 family protein [Puniceibacterium sediminis]|uniref:Ubiquinone biosynthesis protein COQ9 n=1 Tax=Puniceibacterium sediminis TaxID=1608407 RepID=A0A238UTB5_9RHOB|nr:COQ9 family protein [Puniceibacterium sediminis]SNR24937.1 ubiquinone biosynthesis protein COQ9 [Puniceibacterium sediminis]
MTPQYDPTETSLLQAALTHVPFDGWSEATFNVAVADSGVDPVVARALFPRGALDLAMTFHRRGDDEMVRRLDATDMSDMKFRDRVTLAVRLRLEAAEDRETVRRGTTLFSLPIHAADGAKLIWGTADRIWTALGDTSDDVNWYTKRATLSAVYSSTVLYWLGDVSVDHQATWAFLDRRIGDVMQIEKVKAQLRGNALIGRVFAGPAWVLSKVKAPVAARDDLPGQQTKSS